MDRLDRITGGLGYGSCLSKHVEDMIDQLHARHLIRKADNIASADYPLLVEAGIWHHLQYADVQIEPDIVEQIRAAAKEQKVNQTELAKVAGMPSQSAMSNVFKGTRRLTIEEADRLARYLGIARVPHVQWVPLIGLASAGSWNEAVQYAAREFPVPPRVAGPKAFAVEIKGDSMDRILPEGGWAVVDPDQRHLFVGKVYLIQNADHEVTVKRYVGDPARFEPVSSNPMHEPLFLADVPYTVVGRIVSYGSSDGL